MFDETIREHYGTGYERERLTVGSSRIEFARTNELLQRFLPSAPATILDVGGGPGAYAAWLADQGYQVHLVDPLPLHVEQAAAAARARDRSFTVALGDARSLAQNDSSCDAVLNLGPLYHITDRAERVRALAEAKRVLGPGGVVAAAAISRFASLLDGLVSGLLSDPAFAPIVERDLAQGQHRIQLVAPSGSQPPFSTIPMICAQRLKRRACSSRRCLASKARAGCSGISGMSPRAGRTSCTQRGLSSRRRA
jgi:SAM-dependent methyltransferase